jgi:hypothetical protein
MMSVDVSQKEIIIGEHLQYLLTSRHSSAIDPRFT